MRGLASTVSDQRSDSRAAVNDGDTAQRGMPEELADAHERMTCC